MFQRCFFFRVEDEAKMLLGQSEHAFCGSVSFAIALKATLNRFIFLTEVHEKLSIQPGEGKVEAETQSRTIHHHQHSWRKYSRKKRE